MGLNLSESDNEKVMDFMEECEDESKQRCDKFFQLSELEYKEKDLDKKIELLKQVISLYEEAKQWHYKHSRGARLYFMELWEDCHWITYIEKDLKHLIKERDYVIPWILKSSKEGFRQPDIYKEFPDFGMGELRHVINDLVEKSLITKTKKGGTYFISCAPCVVAHPYPLT